MPTWLAAYRKALTIITSLSASDAGNLQWQRDNAPLKAAWPEQDKMQFDIVREPIVVGQTMFFNSSRHDCIRALDTRSGVGE